MLFEAFLGILTAAILFLTALVGYAGAKLNEQVREIHFLVNSHAEEQAERISQLTTSLVSAGVVVPKKPKEDKL